MPLNWFTLLTAVFDLLAFLIWCDGLQAVFHIKKSLTLLPLVACVTKHLLSFYRPSERQWRACKHHSIPDLRVREKGGENERSFMWSIKYYTRNLQSKGWVTRWRLKTSEQVQWRRYLQLSNIDIFSVAWSLIMKLMKSSRRPCCPVQGLNRHWVTNKRERFFFQNTNKTPSSLLISTENWINISESQRPNLLDYVL